MLASGWEYQTEANPIRSPFLTRSTLNLIVAPGTIINLVTQTLLLACFIAVSTVTVQEQAEPANAVFWKELQKLCGKAFAGTVAAAPADDTTFKDKTLVMHVRSCEKDRIRIPFVVGENRSRTWVLTRREDRILLRHDHRHEDGTPDNDYVWRIDDERWHAGAADVSRGSGNR